MQSARERRAAAPRPRPRPRVTPQGVVLGLVFLAVLVLGAVGWVGYDQPWAWVAASLVTGVMLFLAAVRGERRQAAGSPS